MERKFISISELKKVLSPKEMMNVLGGSGDNCCFYRCADPWFEGICDKTQDECWNMMIADCHGSFTIQPCPWK